LKSGHAVWDTLFSSFGGGGFFGLGMNPQISPFDLSAHAEAD
jgi:hypothetical protein